MDTQAAKLATTDAAPPFPADPPPKKPISQTWLGDFLQKLALLLVGFVLTGIVGVFVAEHIKRSFAIQDLKISGYKAHLEDQRNLAEKISSKLSDASIQTEIWRAKLASDSKKPESDPNASDDLRLAYMLESLASSQKVRFHANEFAITFCADGKDQVQCMKNFLDVTEQLAGIYESIMQQSTQRKIDNHKIVFDQQTALLNKSSILESFMFTEMRGTRQRYQNEITKQPWW